MLKYKISKKYKQRKEKEIDLFIKNFTSPVKETKEQHMEYRVLMHYSNIVNLMIEIEKQKINIKREKILMKIWREKYKNYLEDSFKKYKDGKETVNRFLDAIDIKERSIYTRFKEFCEKNDIKK